MLKKKATGKIEILEKMLQIKDSQLEAVEKAFAPVRNDALEAMEKASWLMRQVK